MSLFVVLPSQPAGQSADGFSVVQGWCTVSLCACLDVCAFWLCRDDRYDNQNHKMERYEELLADPARDPVLLNHVRQSLTSSLVSLAPVLIDGVGVAMGSALPQGHGLLVRPIATAKDHPTKCTEAPSMLCKDCSSKRARKMWLKFVNSVTATQEITVANVATLGNQLLPDDDDDDDDADSNSCPHTAGPRHRHNNPDAGRRSVWNPLARVKKPLWQAGSLVRTWRPHHRLTRHHDQLLEVWSSILSTWARMYLLTLLDEVGRWLFVCLFCFVG